MLSLPIQLSSSSIPRNTNLFFIHSSFPLHISSSLTVPTRNFSSCAKQSSSELEEDDYAIGDSLIFEDGAFDDPFLDRPQNPSPSPNSTATHIPRQKRKKKKEEEEEEKPKTLEIEPQNLVPEQWRRVVEEINITKKERRRLARELEYGKKIESRKKKNKGLVSLGNVDLDEKGFKNMRDENELDDWNSRKGEDSDGNDEVEGGDGSGRGESGRVEGRSPPWAVYGHGLDDITRFFDSEAYRDGDGALARGRTKLFTKEERDLLNARIPKLEVATSAKWLPLHSIAASGDFHLVSSLLKHDVDINAKDQEGLTALHKVIICKKQPITTCLLRESANPLVRDKDGATLMHYAVRTASVPVIQTLLSHNVDINLPDNDGWTPLHLAVQAQRTDIVRLLLIRGADKTLKNKDGLTPLELCLYSGRETKTYLLIKLLKQFQKQPRPPIMKKTR